MNTEDKKDKRHNQRMIKLSDCYVCWLKMNNTLPDMGPISFITHPFSQFNYARLGQALIKNP